MSSVNCELPFNALPTTKSHCSSITINVYEHTAIPCAFQFVIFALWTMTNNNQNHSMVEKSMPKITHTKNNNSFAIDYRKKINQWNSNKVNQRMSSFIFILHFPSFFLFFLTTLSFYLYFSLLFSFLFLFSFSFFLPPIFFISHFFFFSFIVFLHFLFSLFFFFS